MRPLALTVLTVLAVLAACGSSEPREPREGAFDPAEVAQTTGSEARFSIDRTAVPLDEMHMGRWLAGIPMSGMARVNIDLSAPVNGGRTRFSKAHGSIAMSCTTCRLGDDIATLDFGPDSFVTGWQVGHVDLESLAIHAVVKDGHATLTQFVLSSPDLKLLISADITLADDLDASKIEGCVRLLPTESLKYDRPKTYAAVSATGASLDHGGMYSIRVTGTLGAPRRLAQECDDQGLAVQ
jgi:type II secretion system protein N